MTIIKTVVCSFLFCLLFSHACAQGLNAPPTLLLGYSTTNIVFKEVHQPDFNFFGIIIPSKPSFGGDGPEIGISKTFNEHIYFELSASLFKGAGINAEASSFGFGQYQNWASHYKLKGIEIPVTANYLFRKKGRKLRPMLGAGFMYLNAHLRQVEISTDPNGVQTITQQNDIKISELHFVITGGIQFRIIPRLYICYGFNASTSLKGRYSDHVGMSVKYDLMNKKNKVITTPAVQ